MEIHKIQREIIKELCFADKLIFSDFKIKDEIEQDLFNYHLQALVGTGYVVKDDKRKYSLTEKGKSIIQFMDVTNQMSDMKMPKVAAQMFVLQDNKVLLSKRLKHPFKGCVGFASGKVSWGEDSELTMKRESVEELGIMPTKFSLYAIRRCIDLNSENGSTIHDAVYFAYLITEFEGEVVNTQESENKWYELSNLKEMDLFPVTRDILEEYDNQKISTLFYKTMITKSLVL